MPYILPLGKLALLLYGSSSSEKGNLTLNDMYFLQIHHLYFGERQLLMDETGQLQSVLLREYGNLHGTNP